MVRARLQNPRSEDALRSLTVIRGSISQTTHGAGYRLPVNSGIAIVVRYVADQGVLAIFERVKKSGRGV
jgi:hypothetical protein